MNQDRARCIGCGCDDRHACFDPATGTGCYWLRVDRREGLGVCSCCAHCLLAWDAGARIPHADAVSLR